MSLHEPSYPTPAPVPLPWPQACQGLTGEISEDCEHSQALEVTAAIPGPSGGRGPSIFSFSAEGCFLPQLQMAEKMGA